MKETFDHVDNKELRSLLSGEKDLGKEELDFVVEETLKANQEDCCYHDEIDNESVFFARLLAIRNIHRNLGDGEDGDAKAFQACKDFWLV